MLTLLLTKHKEKESLSDYTKRLKVAHNVFAAHIGRPSILTKYIKMLSSNDTLAPETSQKESYEQLMAYLYIHNSDQKKYGTVLKHLREQQSLGTNKVPKIISRALHVFSNDHFENTKERKNNDRDCNQRDKNRRNNDKDNKDNNRPKEVLLLSFA